MSITYIQSWPLSTLVYACKLLCLKYELPKHIPLSHRSQPLSFHYHLPPEFQMHQLYTSLSYLPLIHSDLPLYNLYPLPTLSTILSKTVGPYTSIMHTLTLENFELNLYWSRANTSKLSYKTVQHIIYHNSLPTSFNLLNTGNDTIYSTLPSLPFPFSSVKEATPNFPSWKHLPLPPSSQSPLSSLHSKYPTDLHSIAELYRAKVVTTYGTNRG